jgi:hypothetical protein
MADNAQFHTMERPLIPVRPIGSMPICPLAFVAILEW